MRRQSRAGPAPNDDPYSWLHGQDPRFRRNQGREGRGEGRPQGGLQATAQSALAGLPDLQRKEDKRLLPYMVGAFVIIVGGTVATGLVIGGFTGPIADPAGCRLGALVAFIIFGRRAQKSVYSKAEGQTGAAAWALDNLRGKWRVTPGVAATGHFDAVHRVIGRPGWLFVGEGRPPGQTVTGSGEKAHRPPGRRRPDLRRDRRQRRRASAAGQAGAPPQQAARQHHGQADGFAGVAARPRWELRAAWRRCRRGRCRRRPRRETCSAPCAGADLFPRVSHALSAE